ncbi:hypothetical protein DICVIV_09052 [Dictyocaulus viviparus]|uniref:ET module n=1 Tax=Dictyocaulus viviparus TaxID=29172 RepID=A0A0D8XM76_DICVI|nr:hypothetical protein DICVIV_09052 [Dictyocaulus viviparus]
MNNDKHYRLIWQLIILTVFLYSKIFALKCYVGSKGFSKNGKMVHSFVSNECDEKMTHCFESYTDDLSQITASCQSLNTEQRLLDVCKEGCRNHIDLNVTICCCDSDLCNLPPEEKRKTSEFETSTNGPKTELIEENNTTVNSTLINELNSISKLLPNNP